MLYLTATAKRKNALRHIVLKSRENDIQHLREVGIWIHDDYIVEIYDGKWNLIERIK